MFVDLSVQLDTHTPVYPGDPPIVIEQTSNVAANGYALHQITLGTHLGTHVDAPAHMIQDGTTLGDIPLNSFIGPAICIDVRAGFSVQALQAAAIPAHSIVFFDTGTAQRYHDADYFTDYPVMPPEVADFLVAARVKAVGVDTCSIDNTEPYPNHQALLGAGIVVIENLTNLDKLAHTDFTAYILPLKVNLDGAPARVIAEVQE